MEFVISQPKVVRLPRNKKQTYRLNSRPNMCPRAMTLAITLQFEFSRSNVTLTFWRPRSGVRIYQIVTRVTLDVGVPSTNLVLLGTIFHLTHLYFLYFYALQIQLDMAGISPRQIARNMGNLPQTCYECLMGFPCMCFCLFCHGLEALMLGLNTLQTLFEVSNIIYIIKLSVESHKYISFRSFKSCAK